MDPASYEKGEPSVDPCLSELGHRSSSIARDTALNAWKQQHRRPEDITSNCSVLERRRSTVITLRSSNNRPLGLPLLQLSAVYHSYLCCSTTIADVRVVAVSKHSGQYPSQKITMVIQLSQTKIY